MKSLTRIIAVLIVVNFAAAGYVLAQDSRPEEFRQTQQMLAQKQADLAAADARKQADIALQHAKYNLALTRARSGAEASTVGLLVLTSPPQGQDLAMIIEDLTIMSRILDNKLGQAQRHPLIGAMSELDSLLRSFKHPEATQTQAMYVQDYAAIFFIDVDFPLSPPPEVQVEKTKEGTDPVWEETKRQIAGPILEPRFLPSIEHPVSSIPYDKDKVEHLKTDLVKALKHAANIRKLKTDESIILVVTGTEVPTISGSILTIRAKKADIDTYATAKIDYDQFRQRTTILTSRASPGAGQAAQTWWLGAYR